MAEIKRFQSQPVFNKPIGVVRPSRAGVQAAQQMAKAGDAMFKASYEREVINQKKVGRETALSMEIRGTDNKLEIKQLPSGLSPVAASQAQGIIDRRYVEALNVDMKNRALEMREKYENDPEGFDDNYTQYINSTVESAGRYAQQARQIGVTYAGQHKAALLADKLEFEDKIDFKNSYDSIRQEIEDIAAYASSPDEIGDNTAGMLMQRHDDLVKDGGIIDQFIAKHGDRLGVTQATELRHLARSSFYGGQIKALAQSLEVFAKAQNPYTSESVVTQHLRYVQDALRKGSVATLPDGVRENLDQLGFNDDFLQQPGMGRVRDTLASQIAVIEGNREEIFNANRNARELQRIGRKIDDGIMLSGSEAQSFLNSAGMSDAYALAQNLPQILANPQDPQFQPFYKILMGRGALPQAAIDLLGDQGTVQDVIANNPDMLPILQNFYRQATTVNLGGYQQHSPRGLNADATVFWNTMEAYTNSVRTMDVAAFFAKKTELDALPAQQRKDRISRQMKDGNYTDLDDFVLKVTGVDPNDTDQISFLSSYADELVLIHGHVKAGKILKRTSKDVFINETIMFGNFPTRFSPSIAFNGDGEMEVFAGAVVDQLRRMPNYSTEDYDFGKNVFLAADPREGSVMPSYTLVNQDGVPLMVNNEPLIVNSNSVLAFRQAQTQKNRETLLREADEAFRDRLRFEGAVTEARIDESNDMDKLAVEARKFR